MFLTCAGEGLVGVALVGMVYQVAAAVLLWRRLAAPADPASAVPPVTVLKPLHGAEPRLAENLATFLCQDGASVVQLVCGVADPADAAVVAVDRLRSLDPAADIALVVDAARHGANAKVSNLINMMAVAKHDIVVLSDSDMAVPPDYLARVVGALAAPGVGAVTCLYHGRGDAGGWSRLAAMGISHGFLPSVVVGRALGLARPCMGSTIALRRATLDRLGGFAAFADVLADDYAIGRAVRRLGLTVAVPAFTIAHACAETSFRAVVRHELRWAATIRRLDRWGFVGSGLVNPLPLAALATILVPSTWPTLLAALLARLGAAAAIDRATGAPAGPLWLLPVRDCLSFGVFISSFLVQSVDWRGARLYVASDGRITRNEV